MSIAITLTAFCTGIVIVSVLGGILPLAVMLNHTRLQVYLSFSAGAMLGAAFFHMLPEAVRVGSPETLYWTALGLLALFFLERFFSFHHHEAMDSSPPAVGGTERTPRDESAPHIAVDHDHENGNAGSHHHGSGAMR